MILEGVLLIFSGVIMVLWLCFFFKNTFLKRLYVEIIKKYHDVWDLPENTSVRKRSKFSKILIIQSR